MPPAKQPEPDLDINEAAREGARGLIKALSWGIPAAALLYILWMLFVGSDPRRALSTVDDVAGSFNALVGPLAPPSQSRPNEKDVEEFLTYFDSASRDYFHNNVDKLAKLANPYDLDLIKNMSRRDKEREAMRQLLSYEPLSGLGGLLESRHPQPDIEERVYASRSGQRLPVQFRKSGPTWVMLELGGVKSRLEPILSAMPDN